MPDEAKNYVNDDVTPKAAEDEAAPVNPYADGKDYVNNEGTPRPAEDEAAPVNPYADGKDYVNNDETPRPMEDEAAPVNPYADSKGYVNNDETPRPVEDAAAPENPYDTGKKYTNDEVKYDKPTDNSFRLFRSERQEAAKEEEVLIAGVTPLGEAQSSAFHQQRAEAAAQAEAPAAAPQAEAPAAAPQAEAPAAAPQAEAPAAAPQAEAPAAAPQAEAPAAAPQAEVPVAAPRAEAPAAAPQAEAPAAAPQRDLANEAALRSELMSSMQAGKKKSVWQRLFHRKSRYDAIETAMQNYIAETDPQRKEKAASQLYESCRNYLDNHLETYTAGNRQIQKIRDQDKHRVRKQAVVHMLRIMESGQLPEFSGSSSRFMNAKPEGKKAKQGTKKTKLNFREIEASLRAGNKGAEAYRDLKAAMREQKKSNVQKKAAKKGHGMG